MGFNDRCISHKIQKIRFIVLLSPNSDRFFSHDKENSKISDFNRKDF